MAAPLQTGRVIGIQPVNESIRRFWIEVPDTPTFDFKPGQFVTLDLPIADQPAKRMRSYSIASCPDGTNVFELAIVLLENGLGTNYIFHHWKEGTEVRFRGPLGVFTLPEKIHKDLFLICTGTGIATFCSSMHSIPRHGFPSESSFISFGCRRLKDFLAGVELTKRAAGMGKFHYLPTYAREPAGSPLRTGYARSVYEEIRRQNSHKSAVFD